MDARCLKVIFHSFLFFFCPVFERLPSRGPSLEGLSSFYSDTMDVTIREMKIGSTLPRTPLTRQIFVMYPDWSRSSVFTDGSEILQKICRICR